MQNGALELNAALFTQWPGYLGYGSPPNPSSITGWTSTTGGQGVNGLQVNIASGSPFGPTSSADYTYAFIQGAGSLTQNAVKVASAEAPPRAAGPGAVASKAAPAAVDTAPIGSINPARANVGGEAGPTPPDLSAAIPTGVAPTLREAVLSGSPAAQYDLAQQLFEGRALPQDQAKAAFWFARAASAGYPPAEFRLGALYQKGVGVGLDPAAAKRWYQAAAEAGNARAAHNLGVINAEPVGEKADYGEAAKWFRRAAELGVRDSQYNLAVLYARGLGVDQDLRQSWLWFSLAAAQGDAEAAKSVTRSPKKWTPTRGRPRLNSCRR